MTNRDGRHDWRVTGGYDPGRDGGDPRWGRLAVECMACLETRRIWRGLSLDDAALTYGCPAAWVAGGMITAARITVPEPARHEHDGLPPHEHRRCSDLAELRRRRLVSAVIALAAVALIAGAVACIAVGWWPPLAVTWGALMCDTGLITWGIVDRRRPPSTG